MMFNSFIEGFLLGLGAAVPLGPINILMMNYALKSYKQGVVLGLGAMSADMFYLLIILLGIVSLLTDDFIIIGLGILSTIFLGYMAYLIFQNREKVSSKDVSIKNESVVKVYLQGLILTLLNPYTIAFWLSIGGYVIHQKLDTFLTLMGLFCAISLWIVVMPYFVYQSKHKISPKLSTYFSLASSLILLVFALLLLFDVFEQMLHLWYFDVACA